MKHCDRRVYKLLNFYTSTKEAGLLRQEESGTIMLKRFVVALKENRWNL